MSSSYSIYYDCDFQLKEENVFAMELNRAYYIEMGKHDSVTVTAYDAHHCPGAVAFLFEGYFGTILYTGDFRFEDETKYPPILKGKNIDTLYLDNTFCDKACKFPPREVVAEEIVRLVKCHLDSNTEGQVRIGMRSLGKEELLEKIALSLQCHITVEQILMDQLELLQRRNVYSLEKTPIQVVRFHQVTGQLAKSLNEIAPTLVILPTALYEGLDFKPYEHSYDIAVMPYSDHSSFPELEKFVAFIRPKSVIPIVPAKTRGPFGCDFSSRADMSCFKNYLNPDPPPEVIIPDEVKKYMYHRLVSFSFLSINVLS